MEKHVKDRLEKPSKVHFTVKGSAEDGYSVQHHGDRASLSFEHEPGEEAPEAHFSANRGKDVLKHIKKHLNLSGGDEGPISGKSLTDGKSQREVESKGESVGLVKGKAGYKAKGGSGGY